MSTYEVRPELARLVAEFNPLQMHRLRKPDMEIAELTEHQQTNLLANHPESTLNPVPIGVRDEARTALLSAIGTPKNEGGLAIITDLLTSCIEAASKRWPDEQFDFWLEVTKAIDKDVKARSTQAELLHLPDQCDDTYLALIKKRGHLQQTRELNAVLGRAICVSACARHPLRAIVPDGLATIGKRLKGQFSSDANWALVDSLRLIDRQVVADLIVALPLKSSVRRFCVEISHALSSPVNPGVLLSTSTGVLAAIQETATQRGLDGPGKVFSAADSHDLDEENGQEIDTTPDISKRLRTASFGSVASKLGLFHRDLIPPEELASYCHALVRHLDSGAREEHGFALVAILSLLTGCIDRVAVNLKFRHGDSIWISADCASWNWDFASYRFKDSAAESEHVPEPVPIYLPTNIANHLRDVLKQTNSELTLGQAIALWQGHDTFDLDKFRKFIRTIGESAHPLYAGRLARSLPLVYLQVTQSDMTTALLTGRFESVAPAALFYFGPKTQTLWQRSASVYKYLGLGEPCPPPEPEIRIPCKKVLEVSDFNAQWTGFVQYVDQLQKTTEDSAGDAKINALSELSVALCAALVIATGHRSTRPDELTLGTLFSNSKYILINDKDDAETRRSQPRLLPRTPLVNWILNMALQCWKSLQEEVGKGNCAKDPDQPAFTKVLPKSGAIPSVLESVTTGDIHRVIRSHFGDVESNFGRSLWVTHLDEAGCDRWLIRALTGHTRDVTKVTGAYFDIPPTIIMDRLEQEMRSVSTHLFGDQPPLAAISTLTFPLKGQATRPDPTVSLVQDPRTLIEPFDVNIFIGWNHLQILREWFAKGKFSENDPQATAFLSLLCLDLIPDIRSCIDAISDKGSGFQEELGQSLIWRRPHFVHPTLLPICELTRHLISKCTEQPKNPKGIVEATGLLLAQVFDSHDIPFDVPQTEQLLAAAVDAFRRMELPPSLYCVSLPQVSAPTLSPISMHRLSHGSNLSGVNLSASHPPLKWRPFSQRTAKTPDVQHLLRCLRKYSSDVERLGEKRKRANDCREALNDDDSVVWTPFGSWLFEWVDNELYRTYQGQDRCYALSSIATYLSVLAQGSSQTDPMEWEEEDWEQYIKQLTANKSASSDSIVDAPTGNDGVKHALGAIARNLRRRQHNVPGFVWNFVNEADPTAPVGSASATLILDADILAASGLIQEYCKESPLDTLRLQLKLELMAHVPLRTSEPSSLKSDCLTLSKHLVIERGGYNTHKNANSIRLIPLPGSMPEKLVKARSELIEIKGPQTFLLRGDGSPPEGERDAELTALLSGILKRATGDASARNYSLRAAAAQNLAWPGWQQFWRKAFAQEVGPMESMLLTNTWQSNWISVSAASVCAGHGDLRSFFGNYWAGWNVIYAIHSKALMTKLPLHTGLLEACDVKPNSLYQARSRKKNGLWDEWMWFDKQFKSRRPSSSSAHIAEKMRCLGNETSIIQSVQEESPQPDRIRVSFTEANLKYLVARSLGASSFAALEICQIPLSLANSLEPLVLPVDTALMLTLRARQAPKPRGVAANLNTLSSVHGDQIIRWLTMMNEGTLLQLQTIAERKPLPASVRNSTLLQATTSLPKTLCLQMRIGKSHARPEDRRLVADGKGAIQIFEDIDLGAQPVIAIALREKENRVAASRLTSVFRVSLFTSKNVLNHDQTI